MWADKIPYGDISCAFALIEGIDPELKRQIEEQYALFEGEAVQKIYEIGSKYGIGVDHPSNFDELYDEYVLSKNRAQSLRIYTDFSAETQRLFSADIEQASPECAVVCIVDNYMSGANRAKEVIEVISEKCSTTRRNIIGSIFSSKESITRTPKNALAELLPAKVRHQTQFDKWANDLRSASIYSFRKTLGSECEVLQVEYQNRQYIANEVLNLCSFNSDGQCRISLSEPLGLHQEQLMPTYMTTYYSKLQHFFNAVKALRMRAEDEFETVIAEEYSPRLLSFKDFDKTSETVSFDLRRVCRLTHDYVFYLYKLYLEYRGRKPFQTINLIRQEDTALPVLLNKKESGQYLSFRSVPNPNNNNRKNWCWIIDASELNRVLGLLGLPILSKPDQDVILKDDSTELNLEMGKKAKIVKAKQKVYFEYYSK